MTRKEQSVRRESDSGANTTRARLLRQIDGINLVVRAGRSVVSSKVFGGVTPEANPVPLGDARFRPHGGISGEHSEPLLTSSLERHLS